MKCCLRAFLKTGRLGDLRLGMTRAEIAALLGRPDAEGGTSRKYKRPSVWRYGTMECWFGQPYSETCKGIYIERSVPTGPFVFPASIDLIDWDLTPSSSRHEVMEYLSSNEIDFTALEPPLRLLVPHSKAQTYLHLGFDDEDDTLWSFALLPE
jgi:hypothetical protein